MIDGPAAPTVGSRPAGARVSAVALFLFCAAALEAQQVEGAFQHSERGPIEPAFAAAFPTRSSWDSDRRGLQIMLTPVELDVETALLALDPATSVANQEGLRDANYVTVVVWDDGEVAMNARYDLGNAQFILDTDHGLESTLERTEDRVSGRLWSPAPIELSGGESCNVDFRFDTTITQPPPTTPLPAGGGAAGEALLAFAGAVLERSWQKLRPLLSEERARAVEEGWAESDQERVEQAAGSLYTWVVGLSGPPAESVTIESGHLRVDGDADLEVRIRRGGASYLCRARMVRHAEAWHFDAMVLVAMD